MLAPAREALLRQLADTGKLLIADLTRADAREAIMAARDGQAMTLPPSAGARDARGAGLRVYATLETRLALRAHDRAMAEKA